MNIAEAIKKLAEQNAEVYCKICTVDEVYEAERTVDVSPIDESAPILGVNLQANQSADTGLVLIPEQGSHVVVAWLNKAAAVVVLTEKVTKALLKIEDVELTIEAGTVSLKVGDTTAEVAGGKKITLNGGENGGLVKVKELENSLNSLKEFVEAIHQALPSAFNAVGAAMSANGVAAAKAYDGLMTGKSISIEDIENPNVTH